VGTFALLRSFPKRWMVSAVTSTCLEMSHISSSFKATHWTVYLHNLRESTTRSSSRIIKIPKSLTSVKHWAGWEGVWKTQLILRGNSHNEANMQWSSITCSNTITSFSPLLNCRDWRRLFKCICAKIMKVQQIFLISSKSGSYFKQSSRQRSSPILCHSAGWSCRTVQ